MKKEDLKELIEFFSQIKNVTRFKLKQDGLELELEKQNSNDTNNESNVEKVVKEEVLPPNIIRVPIVNSGVNLEEKKQKNTSSCITSPMVGTFYQAPSPDATPFVKVGDRITKGQTIAIIEAMKIMNEIEAEYDCLVKKILLEDGEPVEFDMPLFEVEKI